VLAIILRALESVLAVVAGMATTLVLGEGNGSKLAAVGVAAAAAIVLEYLVAVAPKRWRWARAHLDPRAVFEGVWIQNVKHVAADTDVPKSNRFAIFTVTYSKGQYLIEGTAYDREGREHSRWAATELIHFSPDGRSLTYLWRGTVMGGIEERGSELDRTGFCSLQLSANGSAAGRVDHVSMRVTMIFNATRVTRELVRAWSWAWTPDSLESRDERDRFATHYARVLDGNAPVLDPMQQRLALGA
jgi:hypothetical protein